MQTLEEYYENLPAPPDPGKSGIMCPECGKELLWAEESLIAKHPPMRRLVCSGCEFTTVVPMSRSR